ncbi:hypothetical protein ACK6D9_03235 [Hoeflea sp. Naph1]|uniref:hypothetical protein n=1 Tax=Hoeflea sp. Naph1 TaxID=3388653 RepID=UPI00398F95A9
MGKVNFIDEFKLDAIALIIVQRTSRTANPGLFWMCRNSAIHQSWPPQNKLVHQPTGNVPPAEAEANVCTAMEDQIWLHKLESVSLRSNTCGSLAPTDVEVICLIFRIDTRIRDI